ncbi:MAG: hypothetical protein JXB47_15330 [Anaerolineae bacterium]|nr:hypothetical protein [Anaerolineae bacterium]
MQTVLRTAWVLTMSLAALLAAAAVAGALQPAEPLPGVVDSRCPMPCWQGIRPGVTAADEAVSLLSISPFVGMHSLRFIEDPTTGELLYMYWDEMESRHDIRRYGQIRGEIRIHAGVVWSVDIGYYQRTVTLGDVITQMGIPEYVGAFVDYNTASKGPGQGAIIALYYPEVGLKITGQWSPWWSPLWTGMRVQQVSLTAPSRFPADPDAGPWYGPALRNYMQYREY